MPKNDKLVTYLISDVHKSLGHMGRQTLISTLRKTYWTVGVNSLVKSFMRSCITCRKYNAQPVHPKMSDLPADRVSSDEPAFTHTGIDFFGPFEVTNGRKQEKRYGVIYSCMSSRATHIEMAGSLTTDSFLNSFRRFVARRGNVKFIRSDNATNLKSGCKELNKCLNIGILII